MDHCANNTWVKKSRTTSWKFNFDNFFQNDYKMFSTGAIPFNTLARTLYGGAATGKGKGKGKGKGGAAQARRNMQILGTLALLKQLRGGRKPGPKKGGGKKGGRKPGPKKGAKAAAKKVKEAAKDVKQAATSLGKAVDQIAKS